MSYLRTGALTALLLSSACAAPTIVITYDGIPARVKNQNPQLAAARQQIGEAFHRASQSGRLENPRLDASFRHSPSFREGGLEIGISQKFPVTDRLAREKEISQAEIKAAELEVEGAGQKLIAEARAAFIEVLTIRKRRELLGRQSALTNELAASISAAAEKGEGSPLDAGQARVEAMQSATEMRQLDAKEAAATGVLKALLGIRPSEAVAASGTLGPARLPSGNSDPSRRADYRIAQLENDIAARQVDLEKTKRYEDWEGGVFVSGDRSEDAPSGYENEAMVGFKLSIPLPFWNKNEAKVAEAVAAKERKRLETKALASGIRAEADATLAEMREWAHLVAEIDSRLLPLATKQAADTETAWRNGQTEFQSVLKSRAQRLQLEMTRLDALRDFHLARARHQAAGGNF